MVSACACGSEVFIKKTGECSRCYQARKYDERLAAQGKTRHVPKAKPLPPKPEGRPRLTLIDLHQPISYFTAHTRVKAWRGAPSQYSCVCGVPAQTWAYIGGSPYEQTGTKINGWGKEIQVAWSPDVNDYMPLCRSCHYFHDRKKWRSFLSRAAARTPRVVQISLQASEVSA